MRKALSAENLASFAQSTFGSLRRFIVPNGEEVSELATYTRTIEDRCVRGYAIDSRALVWAQLLEQEIAAALCPHSPSPSNGSNLRESSVGGTATDVHKDSHALPPVCELLGSGMSTPTESSEYGGSGTHQLPPHRSGIPWGGGGMAAAAARGATPGTPTVNGERVPLNPKRKAPSEAALLAALECCRLVYRTYGDDGISIFREARLLPTLLTCLEGASCSKKLVEAVQVFLLDALGGVPSTCLSDVSEDLHALISLTSPPTSSSVGVLGQSASSTMMQTQQQHTPTTQFLGPKLRTLLLLYATLKRADLACVASSNEAKSGLVQIGMLDSLIRIATDMKDHYNCAHDAAKSSTSKSLLGGVTTPASSIPASKAFGTSTSNEGPPTSLFLAVGIAAIGVIGGLIRSNVPNKQELVDQHPAFFSLWSFYAGHVNRMDSAYSFVPVFEISEFPTSSSPAAAAASSVTTPKLGAGGAASAFVNTTSPNLAHPASPHTTKASHVHRGEEQVVVCDSAPHWAPELAEILIELSTSDSFALTRQSLIHEVVTESQAPFHITNSTADGGALDCWEQLPGDWDALVSAGSVIVWRMTSAVSNCSLSASSAKQLLDALRNLDLASRGTDYVFRTTLACLIIICRASPINMDAIAEADGMRALVSMMVNKKSSVLTFEEDLGGLPRASVSYGRPSWEICRSLLALLMFTNPHSNELRTLMTAIGDMLTQPTCVEDCEIIEFCLHTIGSGTYPKRVLWFTSADAKVVCPVDRFAGRWYGYTFVAWVNPLCIWSSGSQIFAYAESATPSAVVLTIVANGKSKCLAIKSISGSETLMTMLDGATLGEGWSHIAVVHNISGYVVWVNGKRRSAPSTTVPFPKEPSKPHKLTFSFGGGGTQGSGVLPFLGMMTTPQLIDGSIQDKDIERLYQAGAGSTVQSLDPPIPLQPFLEVDSTFNTATTPLSGLPTKELTSPNNSVILGSLPKGTSSDQGLELRLSASDIPPPMGDSFIVHRTISPIDCVREGSVKSTPSSPSKGHLSPPPQHLVRRCSSYNKAEDDSGSKGRVVGLLAKPREIEVDAVFFAELPNVPDLLVGENVISWFRIVIGSMDDSSNSHSVAILCIEMLTVYARQVREGVVSIYASGVLEDLRAKLLSWEHIPVQVVPILVELGLPFIGVRTLVNHPLSTQLLQLVVDIAAQDKCPASTRSGAFRELSSLLSFSDNLRLFKNGPKLESLLALCSQIPLECTDDFVVLVEKVVKDTPEMTQLFQFLIHEPEGPSSHPSPLMPSSAEAFPFPAGGASTPSNTHNHHHARNGRVVPTIKCSVLRMIYDVSKSNPSLIDMLGSVGAVQQLMIICHSATSEVIRVYALRLLALILHASKRQKESFIRANGFETLSYVLSDGAANDVPLGIPTFNCLFKFALDFFQVTTSDVNSSVMSKLRAFQTPSGKSATSAAAGGGAGPASHKLDGHLPSLIPESNRRTVSMDMSSMYSGDTAGDMESRLSIDDSYSNQTRGGMIHPQLMQTIFQLLNVVLRDIKAAYKNPTPETSSRPQELERQNTIPGSDGGSETPSTTASSRHADDCIVAKVMDYTSKVFDVAVNSEAVVAFPWLDWVWSGVSEVYLHPAQYPRSTFTVVDKGVRSILRKIVLADLYRGKSVTQIKKVKDFADLPQLQQIVLEEVTRYFSASNRLDALKQDVATHVIRNLDTLLLGIDECISPFPLNIGLEVVNAVKSMTVNSNNWVRGRIRNNSRLLETRDRLAFLLLTSLDHLQGERREYLSRIVDANLHDPNSALVLLRLFVDAYDNKSAERVELIQSMLCELVDKDASFSKTILKFAANDADFLQVLKGGSSNELFTWCATNDVQWKNLAQSILKSSKPIESEVSARHDKREKEVTGRKKLRKVEVDKRLTLQRKASTDFDRVKGELESRQASYESAIAQRRRELLRRGASVGATPPMLSSPTATSSHPTPSSPPSTPGDRRRVGSE